MPRQALRGLRLLVRPDTILRWHRDLLARQHAARSRPKRPGRPPTLRSIRALVLGWSPRTPDGDTAACTENCWSWASRSPRRPCGRNITAVLRDPVDKALIYRELGLNLTYRPTARTVSAQATPSGSCTKLCPRGDRYRIPTRDDSRNGNCHRSWIGRKGIAVLCHTRPEWRLFGARGTPASTKYRGMSPSRTGSQGPPPARGARLSGGLCSRDHPRLPRAGTHQVRHCVRRHRDRPRRGQG
jgi:hypothetical protein